MELSEQTRNLSKKNTSEGNNIFLDIQKREFRQKEVKKTIEPLSIFCGFLVYGIFIDFVWQCFALQFCWMDLDNFLINIQPSSRFRENYGKSLHSVHTLSHVGDLEGH